MATQQVIGDLFDPPSLYTSKAGNVSIKLGSDFHGAAYWRKLISSVRYYEVELDLLCTQLEKES